MSLSKGIMRFGKKGKLSPRFIGPYEIVARVGKVAYKLDLPANLGKIHNVFHISQLRSYISDPSHIIPPDSIQLKEDLQYEERPVQILDSKVRSTRSKETRLVKVLWKNHKVEEATWELEKDIRTHYPELFSIYD